MIMPCSIRLTSDHAQKPAELLFYASKYNQVMAGHEGNVGSPPHSMSDPLIKAQEYTNKQRRAVSAWHCHHAAPVPKWCWVAFLICWEDFITFESC